jgi:hypothetical protein
MEDLHPGEPPYFFTYAQVMYLRRGAGSRDLTRSGFNFQGVASMALTFLTSHLLASGLRLIVRHFFTSSQKIMWSSPREVFPSQIPTSNRLSILFSTAAGVFQRMHSNNSQISPR